MINYDKKEPNSEEEYDIKEKRDESYPPVEEPKKERDKRVGSFRRRDMRFNR